MSFFKNFIIPIFLYISFAANAINSTQEQIHLTHPKFPDPLTFNITLPSGYAENTDKSYILMFDFHHYSDTYLRGMHDWMSHNGEWPWLKTIFVTPEKGNPVGKLFDSTGKTTPLLDFFYSQLFPAVDKKYRTNGFKIMSGFRVNGTIVLSALINKPDLANAFIAISPELANDNAAILSTANKKLTKLNNKPRFLLFSHGTNIKEEHQMPLYSKFHNVLTTNAPKELDWQYKHFDNSYFMSLPLLSIIMGIESLFDDIHNGLAPDSPISQKGVAAIVEHYNYLSTQKYGFEVSPKGSINNLGFYLLNTSPQEGLNVFKDMVHRYPNDAYSHHNLASAYELLGDFGNAVKHQQDAVRIADNMQTWHKKRHRKFLDTYLAKSNESKN